MRACQIGTICDGERNYGRLETCVRERAKEDAWRDAVLREFHQYKTETAFSMGLFALVSAEISDETNYSYR